MPQRLRSSSVVSFLLLKSFPSAAAMKPGVAWPDMHRLMWRILLTVQSRLR